MYKTTKEYLEAEDKEIYTSATAEYRRTIYKSITKVITKSQKQVWDYLINDLNKNNEFLLHKNGIIKMNGKKVFIVDFQEEKKIIIGFVTKDSDNKNQFIRIEYMIKKMHNGFVKLTYREQAKRMSTIIGLNGQWGSIKYRNKIKKKALKIFEKIQKLA